MIQYLEKDVVSNMYHLKSTKETSDNHKCTNGSECVFLPVDEFTGLKVYRGQEYAKTACLCQTEAHSYEIGPEVLSDIKEFIFPISSGKSEYSIQNMFYKNAKVYGYYTQLADTKKVGNVLNEIIIADVTKLKNKCREHLSWIPQDVRDCNVGYIGDRLVLIDFGELTTRVESPEQLKKQQESPEARQPPPTIKYRSGCLCDKCKEYREKRENNHGNTSS